MVGILSWWLIEHGYRWGDQFTRWGAANILLGIVGVTILGKANCSANSMQLVNDPETRVMSTKR